MPRYEDGVEKERAMKDEFMARHPESPFLVGEVLGFHGLNYFPIDERFRLDATLERKDPPPEAVLRTNRDGHLTCRYVGDLRFTMDGAVHSLQVFHAGEQVGPSVFIPFRDATCGSESYGPGRYLILQLTEDDRYVLDFNLAFNPYCAYTDRYECGFPPAENDLPLEIRAGEMSWSGEAAARAPTPRPPAPKSSRSAGRPKPRARAAAPKRSGATARSARGSRKGRSPSRRSPRSR